MRSVGQSFPSRSFHIGNRHCDLLTGGIYRYLGGPIIDLTNSWLLKGGELAGHPDTSGWGARQAGALWYNRALQCWFGWSGSAIVTFCAVEEEEEGSFDELCANPHDFGVLNPSETSGPLEMPANGTLYFDTSADIFNDGIIFEFTNPVDSIATAGHVSGTFEEIGPVVLGQTLAINHNSGQPTFTVSIATDPNGDCVIATATLLGLL